MERQLVVYITFPVYEILEAPAGRRLLLAWRSRAAVLMLVMIVAAALWTCLSAYESDLLGFVVSFLLPFECLI